MSNGIAGTATIVICIKDVITCDQVTGIWKNANGIAVTSCVVQQQNAVAQTNTQSAQSAQSSTPATQTQTYAAAASFGGYGEGCSSDGPTAR